MTRVGFVGLGSMGSALARRLVGHVDLTVFDRDQKQVETFRRDGVSGASSIAELGAECDVVLLCLPTSQDVRRAVIDSGTDSLRSVMSAGGLIIDCTTGDPNVTRAIAAELPAGLRLADAPVSGGPQAAAAGTIALMVGGSDQDFARAAELLSIISPNVRHVGPVGAGHCVKVLNNLLAAGHRLLAFEAVAVAAKEGLDPHTFIDVVNMSSGRSYATEVTVPRHLFGDELVQGFSIGLMAKDVGLATGLIPLQQHDGMLAPHVDALFRRALAELGAGSDVNEIIGPYELAFDVKVTDSRP